MPETEPGTVCPAHVDEGSKAADRFPILTVVKFTPIQCLLVTKADARICRGVVESVPL